MNFFIIVSALIIFTHSAIAAETQPGEACAQAGLIRATGGPGEAVARTLICDGTVWKVADERSNTGKTLLQIGNDTGACNADKQGRLRFDGLNVEICNGTLWSELVAGAGSGGLRYAGITPTSYSGSMGGIKGANDKCRAAFPNSRIMSTEDIVKIAHDITGTTAGWVHCVTQETDVGSGYSYCLTAPYWLGSGATSLTCNAWMGTAAYGIRYQGSTSATGLSSCTTTNPIHCVYD